MDDDARLSGSGGEASLSVGVIGAGRVGSALARALRARGHRISSVAARTRQSAAALADDVGATPADPAGVARDAGIVILAVPDDALAAVVGGIAASVTPRTWVVHTCGRAGVEPLRGLATARVAAVHPAAPVATSDATFDGTPFGVTCDDDEAWRFAQWLVRQLNGTPVRIREEDRVLYHAALVIASNFTVGLAGDAIDLASREVVLPLLRATLDNLERMGSDAALTGPVVRGDAGTVRAHVRALHDAAPALLDAYRANSERLIARARRSGRLSDDAAQRIKEALW